LRQSANDGDRLGFRVEFTTASGISGYYSVRFMRTDKTDYIVERERCFLDQPGFNGYQRHFTDSNLDPELQVHLPIATARNAAFKPVFDLFQGWHSYNFSPKDFRLPIPSGNGKPALAGDGGNLANVVNHLFIQHPEVFARILEYLRAIYPALSSVEPVEFRGYRTFDVVLQGNNGSFSPTQVSDGTLRALAVLVALFQHLGGTGAVDSVGLEEPEAALHPAAAGVLFDAMREASASVQVIATTHSADLLDKKEIDTDAILAVELQNGVTRIGQVDETGRQALKKHLYTAGELMRMNYLRPESAQPPNDSDIESLLFGDLVSA
jgi:hypothetical protein